MNREQKIALSVVITTLLGICLSAITVTILYLKSGMPTALKGLSFMAICGLGGLSALIVKKEKGKVTFDERDKLIQKRAGLAGFALAYLFVGLACMIPFYILGPKGVISVKWLPIIVMGYGITMFFFYSVTLFFEYGFGGKKNE
ncbi:MAG: hypothetical protein ACYSSI_05260 [Planctomycetota bacterium]|jgi:hypothetical protein